MPRDTILKISLVIVGVLIGLNAAVLFSSTPPSQASATCQYRIMDIPLKEKEMGMKPQMQFIDVQIALNNATQGGWELVQVGYMNFGVACFKKCP